MKNHSFPLFRLFLSLFLVRSWVIICTLEKKIKNNDNGDKKRLINYRECNIYLGYPMLQRIVREGDRNGLLLL